MSQKGATMSETRKWTSFREQLVTAFDEAGITVLPYGHGGIDERFVIVRPAGFESDREVCNVIAVNLLAVTLFDRDEGLAEFNHTVNNILRDQGVFITGTETVDYDPFVGQHNVGSATRTCTLFRASTTYRGLR